MVVRFSSVICGPVGGHTFTCEGYASKPYAICAARKRLTSASEGQLEFVPLQNPELTRYNANNGKMFPGTLERSEHHHHHTKFHPFCDFLGKEI